jgi:hypothetical protein
MEVGVMQSEWLQPVDPLAAASLPIRIDSHLGVDDDTASLLQRDTQEMVTIISKPKNGGKSELKQ